jgi:tRNA(His) 5'-end guanylyltransferase
MTDSLGDRIKRYEQTFDGLLTKRVPVVIRVDGRSFHKYTKGFNRPFSQAVIKGMEYAAIQTAKEMSGFKIGYIQSDEATFVITDYDDINTGSWFDYRVNKINSISASLMSSHFNYYMANKQSEYDCKRIACFDSRCFNVPEGDVSNVLLWRAKDWERNSLQMYCREFFSHKELYKKNRESMHEMLFSIGKNWANDLDDQLKNGTFLFRLKDIETSYKIVPDYKEIEQWFKLTLAMRKVRRDETSSI